MKPIILITALALIGSHWAVYKWSDAKTQAKQSEAVTRAVEAANEESLFLYQEALNRVDSLNVSLNQERAAVSVHTRNLRHVKRQLDANNTDMESRRRSLVELCRVLDSATNSANLPDDSYPKGDPRTCEAITLGQLSLITAEYIERYNIEAIRANGARVDLESAPCVN